MKYLLDTNVLRELGKTTPHQNVAAWLNTVDDADLAISTLSVREITEGTAKLRKKKPETAAALEHFVTAIFDSFEGHILPVDCRTKLPVFADERRSCRESEERRVAGAGTAAKSGPLPPGVT